LLFIFPWNGEKEEGNASLLNGERRNVNNDSLEDERSYRKQLEKGRTFRQKLMLSSLEQVKTVKNFISTLDEILSNFLFYQTGKLSFL
jgi:hypothetical protein